MDSDEGLYESSPLTPLTGVHGQFALSLSVSYLNGILINPLQLRPNFCSSIT
jgi:hypothetical protein